MIQCSALAVVIHRLTNQCSNNSITKTLKKGPPKAEIAASYKLLEMFQMSTLQFSKTKFATIRGMHLLHRFIDDHLRSYPANGKQVNSICQKMRSKLEKHYNLQNEFFIVGTILDPQTKLGVFGSLEKRSKEEIFRAQAKEYVENAGIHSISQKSNANTLIGKLHEKKKSIIKGSDEISLSLGMDIVSDGANILSWWGTASESLPNLSKMTRDYLAVMPSSTVSERVFSTAGQIIPKSRNGLTADTAEASILLNSRSKMASYSRNVS